MKRYIVHLFIFSFLTFSGAGATKPMPADFAREDSISHVKISPTGEYLAVRMKHEDRWRLAVFDTKTFEVVNGFSFAYPKQVGDFYWVNEERIVLKIMEARNDDRQLKFYGELYALNYDGKQKRKIFGYSAGESSTGSRMEKTKSSFAWADIVSFKPGDDRNIIISSTPMSKGQEQRPKLYRLNVYNGKTRALMERSPIGGADFITNRDNSMFMVSGLLEDGTHKTYFYNEDEGDWVENNFADFADGYPVAFDNSGKGVFYLSNASTDTLGLYKYSLTSNKNQKIFVDSDVDITDFSFTSDKTGVYAIRLDVTYPEYLLFDKKDAEAKVFRKLLSRFGGWKLYLTSSTSDDKKWIVFASTDTQAGNYYLYDDETGDLHFLFKRLSGIDETAMSPMQPVTIPMSDGSKISGFLTFPSNKNADTPLVVLVHGGPISRDYWGFDSEVQMLANEGYAVLQVNFRGSDGFGNDFQAQGYQRWGSLIQEDIISSAKWAQKHDAISDDKACIMGASFGGYSAVQASLISGNYFTCAIASMGVYRLDDLYKKGRAADIFWGDLSLEKQIGNDKEKLALYSPINHLHKLNTPLLLIHGEKDEVTPIEQLRDMTAKLDELKKPYDLHLFSNEGHGLELEESRIAYYQKIASFLRQHLK